MTQARSEMGLGFVVKWVIAVAIGNVLMLLVTYGVMFVLGQTEGIWGSPILRLIVITGLGALAGALFGSAEAYPLVRYISHPGHWIVATAAGMAIGILGNLVIADTFISDLILGATVGVFQWLVLRNEVSQAGWWIPAHIIAVQLKVGTDLLGVVLLILFRRTSTAVNAESPATLL